MSDAPNARTLPNGIVRTLIGAAVLTVVVTASPWQMSSVAFDAGLTVLVAVFGAAVVSGVWAFRTSCTRVRSALSILAVSASASGAFLALAGSTFGFVTIWTLGCSVAIVSTFGFGRANIGLVWSASLGALGWALSSGSVAATAVLACLGWAVGVATQSSTRCAFAWALGSVAAASSVIGGVPEATSAPTLALLVAVTPWFASRAALRATPLTEVRPAATWWSLTVAAFAGVFAGFAALPAAIFAGAMAHRMARRSTDESSLQDEAVQAVRTIAAKTDVVEADAALRDLLDRKLHIAAWRIDYGGRTLVSERGAPIDPHAVPLSPNGGPELLVDRPSQWPDYVRHALEPVVEAWSDVGESGGVIGHVLDPLTGVPNHSAIQASMRQVLDRTPRGERLAAILFDVADFGSFNEAHGFDAGDALLRQVAQGIDDDLPTGSIIGRLGRDEFLALVPVKDMDCALRFSREVRHRVSGRPFRTESGDDVPINLIAGIAIYPDEAAQAPALLGTAQRNLEFAKVGERGQFQSNQTSQLFANGAMGLSFELLDSIVTAVDNKDRYTRIHSEEVTEYAIWTAEQMGLDAVFCDRLRIAGLLHDLGKIGVPYSILRKPGKLTEEEFELMRQHPTIGAMIVRALPDMEDVVDGVLYHHERWDGGGYPEGLAGEEIPLMGRILAVADAMSAMTTNRPYRAGMKWETALGRIREGSGSQFDPTIAEAFLIASVKRWRETMRVRSDSVA